MRGKKVKEPKQKKIKEKKKKEKEIYVPVAPLLGDAPDYHVHIPAMKDKIIGFVLGFGIGMVVVMVFFRSILLSIIVSAVLGYFAIDIYNNYLLEKRKQTLLLQFKDLLETLTASYSAGLNTRDAFRDAINDMVDIYGEDADIVAEVDLINDGMASNFTIEKLLENFAQRSGLDDIESFANVFDACLRQGANIKDVISQTRDIINDKIEMEMEIKTLLASNQNELYIMLVMPLVIMLTLSGMSDLSVVSNTPINVVVKLISIGIFIGAFFLGKKITKIEM